MEAATPENGGGKLKQFGLSTLATKNRTTVVVLTFIIMITGLYAYVDVPKESFPEINIPQVYIGTAYPGNSPTDVEKLITRPLEKELNTITGVDVITSSSAPGYSAIDIKFTFDVSSDEALRKVKDKVDVAMSDPDFPKDLPADPNVFAFNISELVPIMNINLSGDFSLDDLKDYAEILEERIEQLPEISQVDIRGVMDKEVEVQVDYLKAEAMQVSFNDISGAIQQENVSISGGDILVDDFRRTLQVVGEFKTVQDIENIIVKSEGGFNVYLRDLATVSFREKEKESFAREYMKPVVTLDIKKRAGQNIIAASDKINAILEETIKNDLPSTLNVSVTNDQSGDIRSQVDELQNSIIFGVILVVGVLLFFLGLRNASFVGIAIPLSMFLSFIVLYAMGITFNVMVLFSLVLALGMLVDNGIVVVENIYRLMDEKGFNSVKASIYGVGEVAWPIIASTATTLAAFLPLAIWPGIFGEFMKYLPITLIIVLSSSLFVALVINPVFTAMFMRVGESAPNYRRTNIIALVTISVGALLVFLSYGPATETEDPLAALRVLGNIFLLTGILGLLNTYVLTPAGKRFQENFLPRLERGYERFLNWVLAGIRPWLFFFGMFVLFFVSMVLMGMFTPKVDFFPANEPQYLNIFIEKPIGTSIEATNEVALDIERRVTKVVNSDAFKRPNKVTGELESFVVNSIIGQVGNGTSDPNAGPQLGNTPNKARITVSFVKFPERRGISTNDVLNAIRDELRNYPEAEIVVAKNENGPPQGAPINIEVKGADYDTVLVYAENIKRFIEARRIGGIEELKLDVNKQKPEMPVTINRDKARRYGLSTYQVGDAIRTALYGREVSTFKDGEDDYPINIRFNEAYRNNADALMNQKITFRDPSNGRIKQVPISAVADYEKSNTFSVVKRKDLDRLVTIQSNVLEGYNANEIVLILKQELAGFEMPDGCTWEFTGQQEEQAKELAFLVRALMIALFLIFLIIVAQFNSTSTPFIIGFSVFFSMIGVLLGLVIFQMDFVILMTMVGIISLAGVVVNNAIVLIDYTNLLRERRREELGIPDGRLPFGEVVKAIIEGGKTRLRPVLLTAITTVLGLLPLAIGLNIDFVGFMIDYDPNFFIGGDNNVFWKPMSWAIIYGLTFATFLTLVIVPVMYWYLARAKYKFMYKLPVKTKTTR